MEDIVLMKRNEARRLIRDSNFKKNEIRIGKNETTLHALFKTLICKNLLEKKIDFVTEAIFENGGRADIFILEKFMVVEIMVSEKENNIENKKKTYPKYLKFKGIKIIGYTKTLECEDCDRHIELICFNFVGEQKIRKKCKDCLEKEVSYFIENGSL